MENVFEKNTWSNEEREGELNMGYINILSKTQQGEEGRLLAWILVLITDYYFFKEEDCSH